MEIIMENNSLRVALSTDGGHIEEIFNKQQQGRHYWAYDPAIWPRRTSVCFPICGYMPEHTYTYQGNSYEIPMHGFLREQTFKVLEQTQELVLLETCYTEDTLMAYPFHYCFRICYRLENNRLSVLYQVRNLSKTEPMLFAVGSHYTYNVPIREQEEVGDFRLFFSDSSNFTQQILKDGLLSNQSIPFVWKTGMPLEQLNTSSMLLRCNAPGEHTVSLQNIRTGSKTVVSFCNFDYCVLWRPFANAPFVCIEPWMGTPQQENSTSALEEKYAMVMLEPQAYQDFTIHISVY